MCESANLSVSAAVRPRARGWRVHLSPRLCSQNVCVLVAELVRVHIGVPAQVVRFGVNGLGGWEGGDGMALIYPLTECLLCAKECAECFI